MIIAKALVIYSIAHLPQHSGQSSLGFLFLFLLKDKLILLLQFLRLFYCRSKFRDRRNSKFYECSSKVLEQLNEARSIYTRQDIFIYRRVPQYHRAPKDGFTLNLVAAYNTTGSCPLTVHPDKNYEQRVIPSLHDCADVPKVKLVSQHHTHNSNSSV